ncbi:hypothetical protein [Actinomadura atramentaria]|nr:hypothetical protein [Actinomadura atramentaria]
MAGRSRRLRGSFTDMHDEVAGGGAPDEVAARPVVGEQSGRRWAALPP